MIAVDQEIVKATIIARFDREAEAKGFRDAAGEKLALLRAEHDARVASIADEVMSAQRKNQMLSAENQRYTSVYQQQVAENSLALEDMYRKRSDKQKETVQAALNAIRDYEDTYA